MNDVIEHFDDRAGDERTNDIMIIDVILRTIDDNLTFFDVRLDKKHNNNLFFDQIFFDQTT